jgi:hypothetical protein
MSSNREATEGRALSKTATFICFHVPHAVSMIHDEVPLRIWQAPSTVGGPEVDRIHDRTLYQIVLEKEQPVRMCAIVSSDWSHNGHRTACGRPRRASRSLVQHLSRQANHMKNFTLGGAQDFQFSSHVPEVTAPWKRVS